MPTTILDGETYPEALQRRYAEEVKTEERMSNDRELLELAANAAGIDLYWDNGVTPVNSWAGTEWNPLHNDAIALRLAVKLNLDISYDCCDRGVSVCAYGNYDQYTGEQCFEEFESDGLAATRRAIVRAAAEIGKELP